MLFTEIVGKTYVDGATKKPLGQIVNIAYDKLTGKCMCSTTNGIFYSEKITVKKNVTAHPVKEADAPLLINKQAYGTDGKLLGTITDVEFTKSQRLKSITANEVYTRGRIGAVGDIVIVKPQKTTNTKPRKSETESDSVATFTASSDKRSSSPSKHTARRTKRYGDFSFLVGLRVDKTVKNFQGEIMLRAGDVITQEVLRQAKISGKLVELCLHIK